jgi:rhomboid protease GluP
MNLYAMYHLGCLVESWYGSGSLIGIYVLTGGGGNLLSAMVRKNLGWDPLITSGGGSVVVMGLVALCAVVGWRAGTRLGDYLRNQMFWVLGLTAAIGLGLPILGLSIVDNWGHACGALVGGGIGLANDWLLARSEGGFGRWSGRLGAGLLSICAIAQVADDRVESVERRVALQKAMKRWEEDERHLLRLEEIRGLHRTMTLPRVVLRGALVRALPSVAVPDRSGPSSLATSEADPEITLYRAVIAAALEAFDSMRPTLGEGQNASDFHRLRALLQSALRDPPTLDEFREFESRMLSLQQRVRLDLETARALSISKATGR